MNTLTCTATTLLALLTPARPMVQAVSEPRILEIDPERYDLTSGLEVSFGETNLWLCVPYWEYLSGLGDIEVEFEAAGGGSLELSSNGGPTVAVERQGLGTLWCTNLDSDPEPEFLIEQRTGNGGYLSTLLVDPDPASPSGFRTGGVGCYVVPDLPVDWRVGSYTILDVTEEEGRAIVIQRHPIHWDKGPWGPWPPVGGELETRYDFETGTWSIPEEQPLLVAPILPALLEAAASE